MSEENFKIKYDEKGLVPAIVQDCYSKKVLMMAYMNGESLEITKKEGYTCFWSRSRGELWRKGETSGNRQRVVSIAGDCDGDTLLIQVEKSGPACHTGSESCFFNHISGDECQGEGFSLTALYQLLEDRVRTPKPGSYTNYLFDSGMDKILKKVGEESTEVIIGGAKGNRNETIYEIADLAYHVLVMMIEMKISTDDVLRELESRHIIDEKKKQE